MIDFFEKIIPFHQLDNCGDFSIVEETAEYYFCCIGDIGGHGSESVYKIACTIKEFILLHINLELETIINLVHKQVILKKNGMTLTLAKVFKTAPLLSFVSVGNVKGILFKPSGKIHELKSQDGIVGYTMPHTIITNIIKIEKLDTIILNTDGVSLSYNNISLSLMKQNCEIISNELSKQYFKNDDDSLLLVFKYNGNENYTQIDNVQFRSHEKIHKKQIVSREPTLIKHSDKLIRERYNLVQFDDEFKLINILANDPKNKEKLNKILNFFKIENKRMIQTILFLLELQEKESTNITVYYHNKVIQFTMQISDNYNKILSSLFPSYKVKKDLLLVDIVANNFLYNQNSFRDFQELLQFGLDENAMMLNKKLQEEVDKKLNELQEKEKLNQHLTNKAYIDNLTGVFNRYKFEEVFEYELSHFKRYNRIFCVAMIDIDHFKKFNDTFGHLIGDEVLTMLAKESKKVIRELDLFTRWGGEEFLVLFPETSLESSLIGANKLRESIASLVHPIAGHITASFGVSQISKNDTLDSLLKRCDDALYKAKENGRNRVEVATI